MILACPMGLKRRIMRKNIDEERNLSPVFDVQEPQASDLKSQISENKAQSTKHQVQSTKHQAPKLLSTKILRQIPDVIERIFHPRITITVRLVRWW